MESDSNSDGSHVSATPPRNSKPPPLSPASPPPPPPTLVSSLKSRAKVTKSNSRSKKPPAKPSQPEREPETEPFSSPLSSPPFQICHRFVQNHNSISVETLPAGYFSKSTSFSKLKKTSLNFEAIENDPGPPISAGSDSNNKKKKLHKVNLIGANAPLPPVKLRKCNNGSEGNFVKLNTNRYNYKRKFKNKKRTTYRRSQRKNKAEEESDLDNFFVPEIVQQKVKDGKGSVVIEEAVLAAKDEASDENLVRLLNAIYGFDSFREGQLEAIKMVLDGKSTMLVLPTGAGKSLCYQIPAVVLAGITLVVSPLVALMIDQFKHLPTCIQGGLLCSSQTPQEAAETLSLVKEGAIKVLFVSPERFLNVEFLSFISATSISLLVVDEAHCISEWSHNFRPSYMRLRASLLRSTLKVGCIIAMTATATTTTLNVIMSALDIPSSNLVQNSQLRDNLQLSVSLTGNRMKDLVTLIKSSPFVDVQSIIVYCKFQSETDIISRYLCDNNISAKSYHSAILSKDRSRIQELFCSNKIRVVVATVAFGMGLDKSDVGAVIHYSLPESLEEYVQEIGRAGRDGRLSYCHLFFDDTTYYKLRSLMHSDGIDEYTVSKFLCEVFTNCTCGKICSIIKASASRTLDVKEEVMLTILTQLELGEVQYLRLLPELNVTCTLNFYKTAPVLLADKDIVVSAILKKSETRQGQYVFDIPTIANTIGVTAIELSNHLQNLKVRRLDAMFNAAVFAVNECEKMQGCNDSQHTPCLQRKILDYFKEDGRNDITNKMRQSSPFLRADIKVFLQSNSQAKFTPRAIARIMQGIPSPAYPSATWSKTHFWGRYTHIDFQVVMEAAKTELMHFAGKEAM
ncbi:rothmund-thomson syndrome DNA helicase recq4, putative [Ricinus communis]|uniref:DNA 3'-5' helicase n=1 Tax=Ricinus communis TaxID=3988 RepID=B9RMM3_RICCO|nr:rothmund-thomson syndrome DNA helicase recq4, putative [Ricinus communis]|eukprot:XP_002514992.1 ATP-dependent DNA helicase Q-like 5 [Ricinus communis]